MMKVVWLSKRHYTHKDALVERFGRIYQLPLEWANSVGVRLELLDYYGNETIAVRDGSLDVASTPIRSPAALYRMMSRILDFRPNIIVASGDCFIGMLGLYLARRAGVRFAFDVYDDYRKFGGYRIFFGWDAFGHLVQRADLVLYASQALAEEQIESTPWRLVPNGVDPTMFHAGDPIAARKRLSMAATGIRWVGYFGGMEPERGSEDLIAAVGLLYAKNPSVRLVLCGKSVRGQVLDKPWVDYRGSVEHSLIPDFINACDVVVLPYRRGPIIDKASSCKIAEYLFCERPLVATATPNLLTNFPLQASELGPAICRPSDPTDLARAIAFQLARRRVASPAEQHTWRQIAHDTLASLR